MTKTVLCVEDNPTNLLLVARIVEAEGHHLLQARTGPEALALLEKQVPDIILLDINIPDVDGLEVARQIKTDNRLKHIPLIATTANVLVGDRERCLDAGCDDYLPKPLDIRQLRQIMRGFLQ